VALPAIVDLEYYHGDTWAQTFKLVSNDNPVDLTAAQVSCWARLSELVKQLAATVGAGPGEVTIADPNGVLSFGPWQYDLEVTAADGSVRTWVRGRLIVERDVTHGDQPPAIAVYGDSEPAITVLESGD
jgi:hypothetical protein